MPKKTLLVGCSFVSGFETDTDCIKIIGMPGGGNTVIAERVLSELAKTQYNRVFIIWTGINRIDIPIGKNLASTFLDTYSFKEAIDTTVWYASGGIAASSTTKECPKIPQIVADWYYKSSDAQYLTNQGLAGVLKVQTYLKANNINHQMSFIYDIHNDEYDMSWLCNVLGKVDTETYTYKLIDWSGIQTTNTLYEWGKNSNQLSKDRFHPTRTAIIDWVWQNFQLDIANFERK